MRSFVTDAMTGQAPDGRRLVRSAAESANLGLRFLLELTALAALAYWGFDTGTSLLGDLVLGVGAPLVGAVVWGIWAAPRSAQRLTGWRLTAVQFLVLGAGAVALVAAGHAVAGAALAAVIVVNGIALHGVEARRRATQPGGSP